MKAFCSSCRYALKIMCICLMFGCRSLGDEGHIDSKPNVIHIMLDEWGYYESSMMGHPILETPFIDQVAAEGMRFTQFLAGASVCAPTRSVLMTGQHLGHTTVRMNGGGQALRGSDVTIAEMLKAHGYATGGFGKWGLGDAGTSGVPEKQGFDVFLGYYHQVHAHTYYPRYLLRNSKKIPLAGNSGDAHSGETFSHYLIHNEGLDFIRENHEKPFYAYMAWTPPHGHWHIPSDDPAWIKYKGRSWDASNQRGQHDPQMYAAMIEMVDRQIGEILSLLLELNIDKNTVVFLSGDNGGQAYFANEKHPHGFFAPNLNPLTGERFRGGKREFYEGGLRIPFLVRWPDRISPGKISDHLGYFPDMMPTIAQLTGAPLLSKTDGISIVPTLLGLEGQQYHEFLYWEGRDDVAVRKGDWKAVRPSLSVDFELYNLGDDLTESHNVALIYPDTVAALARYALEAHKTPQQGEIIDSSVGFKGHYR